MVKNLAEKIIKNVNIKYNILSFVNVFLGFLFILYLGRKFGASKDTDIYFYSVVLITYLGYFVQGIWEAMSPYYVELKIQDKTKADHLYSILLNNLVLVAFLIITLYYIVSPYFLSKEQKSFLDIFIFYLLFQNILFFNKAILLLEHFYAVFYVVDIIVYIFLFFTVYFTSNIIYIAYISIFATLLANLLQFYLIFRKVNIKYSFNLYKDGLKLKEIYKNSLKLKLGSLFYGSKDIIIASVFTSFGSGIYSLYSYANKFAGVILQVVNAPILNVFVTKSNYHIANKKFNLLQENIKKVLMQTSVLFVISATITYFLLPFILNFLFGNKFSNNDILSIQKIYLIMVIFYFVIVIESPFARLLGIFKLFNISVLINIMFTIILILTFLLFKYMNMDYITFLTGVILAQGSNLFFAYVYYRKYLRKQNEV